MLHIYRTFYFTSQNEGNLTVLRGCLGNELSGDLKNLIINQVRQDLHTEIPNNYLDDYDLINCISGKTINENEPLLMHILNCDTEQLHDKLTNAWTNDANTYPLRLQKRL
jgi:hypothetical protein